MRALEPCQGLAPHLSAEVKRTRTSPPPLRPPYSACLGPVDLAPLDSTPIGHLGEVPLMAYASSPSA